MNDELRLGAKVRALRRKENLRQAQLAKMLEISPSYLNLIEHDRRPLSARRSCSSWRSSSRWISETSRPRPMRSSPRI